MQGRRDSSVPLIHPDPDPDSLSGKTLLNPQSTTTGHSTHDNPGQTNDKA